MVDLELAMDYAKQAVDAILPNHPSKPYYLNDLGNMLCDKYSRIGKLEHLEQAIACANLAVKLTLDDHPDRAAYLTIID